MVAESWPLYLVMLCAHWAVFIFAPVMLFRAGWPITGGVVMLLSTLMPIAGQAWFTDSDAPGLIFLLAIEAPIAALVLFAGIVIQVATLLRWRTDHPS